MFPRIRAVLAGLAIMKVKFRPQTAIFWGIEGLGVALLAVAGGVMFLPAGLAIVGIYLVMVANSGGK